MKLRRTWLFSISDIFISGISCERYGRRSLLVNKGLINFQIKNNSYCFTVFVLRFVNHMCLILIQMQQFCCISCWWCRHLYVVQVGPEMFLEMSQNLHQFHAVFPQSPCVLHVIFLSKMGSVFWNCFLYFYTFSLFVWTWYIWKLSEFATTTIVFGIYVINKCGLLECNLCTACRLCMIVHCCLLQSCRHIVWLNCKNVTL